MRNYSFCLVLIVLITTSGCSFTRYVDEKGRDCRRNIVYAVTWDTCDKTQEPLATTRQDNKYTLDAQVTQKTNT